LRSMTVMKANSVANTSGMNAIEIRADKNGRQASGKNPTAWCFNVTKI